MSLPDDPDSRWNFVRDVAVFQVKMLIDNARDFLMMPVSLGAALVDLVFKGEREGTLFYKVLSWGAHSEKIIDVYSPLERKGLDEHPLNPNYTIDAVVARLEGVVKREIETGGSAASIKTALETAAAELKMQKEKLDAFEELKR